jgi:predicted RNA polymerase sigma factor
VVRGYLQFDDAEDAVQEALAAAASTWPERGIPENPLGWLIRAAGRRMTDLYRSDEARRRRETLAASWSREAPEPASGHDDTLVLFFLCCHPSLSSASAVALTLRALGGLSTREIAAAFLVPESTMAQRISRAKRTVAASGAPFALPGPADYPARVASVRRVAYLVFNEGYTSSEGPDLARTDLAVEGIRLARLLRDLLPQDPEVCGLLALMLLGEARRPARTDALGALVPLAEQDRARWDRARIAEGTALATEALRHVPAGPYALEAGIAALHDAAPSHQRTDWPRILALYTLLERVTPSPVVALNRAVALAMVEGPPAALAVLDDLEGSGALARSHRLPAVRAHLLEVQGETAAAHRAYIEAAARTANGRERHYLTLKAAATAAGASETT